MFKDLPDEGSAGELVSTVRNAFSGMEGISGGGRTGMSGLVERAVEMEEGSPARSGAVGIEDIEYGALDEGTAKREPVQKRRI